MQIADIEIEELGNNRYSGSYEGDIFITPAPNFKVARRRILKHFGIREY